jgi:hypothetical protein
MNKASSAILVYVNIVTYNKHDINEYEQVMNHVNSTQHLLLVSITS